MGLVFDEEAHEYYCNNIMGRLLMELREKEELMYEKFKF